MGRSHASQAHSCLVFHLGCESLARLMSKDVCGDGVHAAALPRSLLSLVSPHPCCWQTGRQGAMKVVKSAAHYTEAARDEITLLSQIAEKDPGRCANPWPVHVKRRWSPFLPEHGSFCFTRCA